MAERKERQYISASAQQRCKAGVRKTHQEFCEELTQLNFQITPLEEYVSAYTKIKFRCDECGYEWATAPTNITNKKHGCPLCARKRLAQQKLKTTDEFKQTLAEINPQIEVVGEYVSNSTKIECRCLLCGHIWKSLPTNLIKGRSCPECSHTSTSFVEQTLRLSFERIVGADRVLSRDCNTIGMELDLFVPTLGIAIEPGNWFWHKDKIERDTKKRQLCKEHGVRLITIFDGFYGDPQMFTSDFYYTSGSLNEKKNYKVLKDIIYRILDSTNITYRFSIEEWNEIVSKALLFSRKRTTEDFKNTLATISPDIIVCGEYSNNKTGIECRCNKCSYTWSPTPDKLLQGRGCPRCAGTMKKTHSHFCEELSVINPNISVLGEYKNSKTKVELECNVCKYSWSAVPSSLLKGHGCPRCATKANAEKQQIFHVQKNSLIEYFPEILEDWDTEKNIGVDITKLSAGSMKKYYWKCRICGYEYVSSPANRIRHGCAQCARKRTIEASCRKVINLDTQEVFPSLRAAGEKYGGTSKGISNACAGRVKTAYGYRWAYFDDQGPRPRSKSHQK